MLLIVFFFYPHSIDNKYIHYHTLPPFESALVKITSILWPLGIIPKIDFVTCQKQALDEVKKEGMSLTDFGDVQPIKQYVTTYVENDLTTHFIARISFC